VGRIKVGLSDDFRDESRPTKHSSESAKGGSLSFPFGYNMNSSSVPALTEAWIVESLKDCGDLILFDQCHEDPETAWLVILRIIEHDLTPEQMANLAAGPLEDLLSLHGPNFIDRVETEARRNPRFNNLLGGVWQLNMTLRGSLRARSTRPNMALHLTGNRPTLRRSFLSLSLMIAFSQSRPAGDPGRLAEIKSTTKSKSTP
jgi:hypothetical protein